MLIGKKQAIRTRVTISTVALLFLFIAGASAWVITNLDRLLTEKFSSFVSEKTHGEVLASVSSIQTGWANRELCLKNLQVTTNNNYKETLSNKQINFLSPEIRLSGLNIIKLFQNRELLLEKLNIQSPEFLGKNDSDSLTKDKKAQTILSNIIPKILKSVDIQRIKIENFKPGETFSTTSPMAFPDIDNLNLEIQNLYSDSTTLVSEAYSFRSSDIILTLYNANYLIPKKGEIKSPEIQFSTKTGLLKSEDFTFHSLPCPDSSFHWSVYIQELLLNVDSQSIVDPLSGLHFSKLSVNHPQLNIVGNVPHLTENRPDSISTFPLKIILDSLNINDATIRSYSREGNRKLAIDSIQFSTQNISIDSCIRELHLTNKILANAHLNASNIKLNMEDNLHQLTLRSLSYSNKHKRLITSDLKISPQDQANPKTALKISAPSITFRGFNPERAFTDRALLLDEVEIAFPQLEINRSQPKRATLMTRQDQIHVLHNLVSPYLDTIRSKNIYITNGQFNYNQLRSGSKSGFVETGISFHLFDFQYDSTRFFSGKKVFLSDNFEVRFDDYKMKLVDGIHVLKAGKIELSSLLNQTKIHDIELTPASNSITEKELKKANKSTLFDIKIPYCTIWGTDYNNAWFRSNLQVENIQFSKPQITVEHFYRNRSKKQEPAARTDLFDLLFSYIKRTNIKSFAINKGEFTLRDHNRKGKTLKADSRFSFQLKNFYLTPDEVSKRERLLFSDQLDIVLEDHEIKLADNVHFIKVKEIGISTSKSEIYLKEALLYPSLNALRRLKPDNTYLVELPHCKLKGVNVNRMYFKQELMLDSILINHPEISVFRGNIRAKNNTRKKHQILLPKNISKFYVNQLDFTHGSIRYFGDINKQDIPTISSNIDWSFKKLEWKKSINKIPVAYDFNINFSDLQASLKDKTHNLRLEQLDISKLKRNISGTGLNISPDTDNKTVNSSYTVDVPQFSFEKINFDSIWENKGVQIGKVSFMSPKINLQTNNPYPAGKVDIFKFDLYPLVSNFVERVDIERMQVSNSSFNITNEAKDFKSDQVDLCINDFHLSPEKKKSGLLHAGEISFTKHNFSKITEDNLHHIHIDRIDFSTAGKRLNLTEFKVTPLKDKYQTGRIKGHQTDVYNISIPNISFENIDHDELLNNKSIIAEQVTLSSGKIEIFRDQRLPSQTNFLPVFPQKLLLNSERAIKIDKFKLLPTQLKYLEHQKTTDKLARIEFNDLQAEISNITNIPEDLKKNNHCIINASAMLMGAGKLKTEFEIQLDHPNQQFHFSGQLNAMELNKMNPTIKPSALIAIKSGRIEKLQFNVNADSEVATGDLRLFYKDLKISRINPRKQKTARFASWLANNLIVKTNNPGNTRIMFPEEIYHERDRNKSFLNYCWKSIFSGIKETFGIKNQQKANALKLEKKKERFSSKIMRRSKLD